MFRVITDIDLLDAWLSKNVDPFDPDINFQRKGRHGDKDPEVYISLTELIEPPELLIIRLGVKVARNVATPEVLLEALQHRDHLGKPTWLVDQPIYQLREGHIAYDARLEDYLFDWEHVVLEGGGASSEAPSSETPKGGGDMPSLGEMHEKFLNQGGPKK
jgi:hypothetical protein